ncbi:hypothetical protein HD806DRAFT_424647 [Xylariaceae sp. AK1471]|nr:hypothetical protein HD806DRAFT_424647 [Xylariaceae sp. AK1471]
MALSIYQTLRSHDDPYPDQLRRPFSDLAINVGLQRHSGKVCKARSKQSARPSLLHRSRQHAQPRKELLQLKPKQLECAKIIYSTLHTIPNLSNRTPRLRRHDSDARHDRYELQYPVHRLWRLIGDPTLPTLTSQDLRRLRDALIRDIGQLYDAHIAYDPDVSTLSVVKKLNRRERVTTFVPFIDTFDFDKHVNDQATSWADLKEKRIETIKAQFDVLELLAELSESLQLRQTRTDLQPDIVVKLLRQSRPPEDRRNIVIRQVTRYSPELGQFMIEETRRHVCRLPRRTSLGEEYNNESIRDCCSIVTHVLGLMDQYEGDKQVELGHLADRAAMSIIYAALLVHLHAKTIMAVQSRGLLEMSGHATADSYTSYENFQSVTAAYSQVIQTIHCLKEKGGQLDDGSIWILRAAP